MSNDNDFGYGEVEAVEKETSRGDKFLKIEDDKEYHLRIASKPRYVIRHFINNKFYPCTGDTCEYCGKDVKPSERVDKTAQWGWIVIDREDNKVKIFQGPNSVARALKDLSEIVSKKTGNKTWGNPTTFDIMVKKSKQASGFYKYSVNPDPDSRDELSKEELQLVKEADYNLEIDMKSSKESKHLGNYDAKPKDLETAPDNFNPEDIPADLGQEEETKKVVDENDIPF